MAAEAGSEAPSQSPREAVARAGDDRWRGAGKVDGAVLNGHVWRPAEDPLRLQRRVAFAATRDHLTLQMRTPSSLASSAQAKTCGALRKLWQGPEWQRVEQQLTREVLFRTLQNEGCLAE